jgi:hypothetical protein
MKQKRQKICEDFYINCMRARCWGESALLKNELLLGLPTATHKRREQVVNSQNNVTNMDVGVRRRSTRHKDTEGGLGSHAEAYGGTGAKDGALGNVAIQIQ